MLFRSSSSAGSLVTDILDSDEEEALQLEIKLAESSLLQAADAAPFGLTTEYIQTLHLETMNGYQTRKVAAILRDWAETFYSHSTYAAVAQKHRYSLSQREAKPSHHNPARKRSYQESNEQSHPSQGTSSWQSSSSSSGWRDSQSSNWQDSAWHSSGSWDNRS